MTVEELFEKAENNTLTWEQFKVAMGTAKFVDLTEGNYVSKQKYDNEISQRDTQITTLNETISKRDEDLQALQTTLKDAGDIDALKKASRDLSALQKKYTEDTESYKQRLAHQEYEFAVKEFANSKNFTSKAAKRDFVQSLLAKDLTLEDGIIIGAEDFVKAYSKDNEDAFVKKEDPKPKFAGPTEKKQQETLTLTEMMKLKNENPDVVLNF